jgi:hypothetical protein
MTKSDTRVLYLEDVADSVENWRRSACDLVFAPNPVREKLLLEDDERRGLERIRSALQVGGISTEEWSRFVSSLLDGLAHSMMVGLDGGTRLAEVATVQLVDGQGHSLGDGLHEELLGYINSRRGAAKLR